MFGYLEGWEIMPMVTRVVDPVKWAWMLEQIKLIRAELAAAEAARTRDGAKRAARRADVLVAELGQYVTENVR